MLEAQFVSVPFHFSLAKFTILVLKMGAIIVVFRTLTQKYI